MYKPQRGGTSSASLLRAASGVGEIESSLRMKGGGGGSELERNGAHKENAAGRTPAHTPGRFPVLPAQAKCALPERTCLLVAPFPSLVAPFRP